MAWDAVQFTKQLKEKLSVFDRPGTEALCRGLVTHLMESGDDYPSVEAERVLQALRNKRQFDLMQTVGDAFIQTRRDTVKVRRQ